MSRSHRLVGVVCLLLLILAACGSSEEVAPATLDSEQTTKQDVVSNEEVEPPLKEVEATKMGDSTEPLPQNNIEEATEEVTNNEEVELPSIKGVEVEEAKTEHSADYDDKAEPLNPQAEDVPAPESAREAEVTETTSETDRRVIGEEVIEDVTLESDRAKDDDGSSAGRTDWIDDEAEYDESGAVYDREGDDSYAPKPAFDTERGLGGSGGGAGIVTEADGYGVEADSPPSKPRHRQQQAPLRAGEIDDNAKWDDYLFYRRTYQGPYVHDLDVTERYIIDVRDEQGRPVLDAQVRVMAADQQDQGQTLYQASTYATGQTLFHPQAVGISSRYDDEFEVEVSKGNAVESFILTRADYQASQQISERWLVKLADAPAPPRRIKLDLLFLIDATGSMDDEISKVQDTVFDVTARIDALPGQPQVHYGMVTYRDRDDSFVSRTYPFTPDVRKFADNLDTVYADGGGDYPESLNEALHKSISDMSWRQSDTIKLVVLIADAPPHLDYAQDYDYAEEMVTAAEQGIKIFPIASSGLDDQGEYIFRQLAQFTQGRFIFLTYADDSNSGAPGSTTTHHVDDYTVEHLDDLLVQLVTDELAHQNPQLGRR
ncbi:vWA domain-containing protein [Anaerolineales bacterium HSG24]|nr:vWA domain-containing protein [Anaerolineales bacterium HSG24]